MANRVSEEHAKRFDAFLRWWLRLLNLGDWTVVRGKGRSRDAAEIFGISQVHRLATYRIGRTFGSEEVTGRSLCYYSGHESMHLLLDGISHAAVTYGRESDELLAEEHRVIAVLLPLLMEHAKPEETPDGDDAAH